MTSRKRPPLSEIIARTPGANRREDAEAFLKARQEEIVGQPSIEPTRAPDLPEPIPMIDDPDRYGKEFWQRFIEKQGLAKTPPTAKVSKSKKPTQKTPGRPSKRPSPFTVIDGDDETK